MAAADAAAAAAAAAALAEAHAAAAGGGAPAAGAGAGGGAADADPDDARARAMAAHALREAAAASVQRQTLAAISALAQSTETLVAAQRALAKQQQSAPAAASAVAGLIEAAAELEPDSAVLKALAAALRDIFGLAYGPTATDAGALKDMYSAAKASVGAAASVPEGKRKEPLIRLSNSLKALVQAAPREAGAKRKADELEAPTAAAAAQPAAPVSAAAAAMAAAAAAAGASAYLSPPPGIGGYRHRSGGARERYPCPTCGATNHLPANCPTLRMGMQMQVYNQPQPSFTTGNGYGGAMGGVTYGAMPMGPPAAAANWCTHCAQHGMPNAHTHSTANCRSKRARMHQQQTQQPATPVPAAVAQPVTPGVATDARGPGVAEKVMSKESLTPRAWNVAHSAVDEPWRRPPALNAERKEAAGPPMATTPLHALARAAKTRRRAFAEHAHCDFCAKKGHELAHCPAVPTATPRGLSTAQQQFARKLLDAPRVALNELTKQQTPGVALQTLLREAAKWNENNPWAGSQQLRDRLRANAGAWKAFGADRTVLSWILFGARLPHIWKPQPLQFANHKSARDHERFVSDEIAAGIADGTYRVVDRANVRVINPISVTRNPNSGKLRMCVDARWPNAHSAEIDFSLPSIENDLADTVFADDEMISADITKAYHAIPLAEDAMPYLAIEWNGQVVVPTVLPFGSSLAPLIFNKTARQIVRAIRVTGQRVMQYFDDWLFAAAKADAPEMVLIARSLLHASGWRTNDKCMWTPSHRAQFLGFDIDSHRFSVSVTRKRIERAQKLLAAMRQAEERERHVPTCDLESFVGMVVAMKPAIKHATLFAREMMYATLNAREACAAHVTVTERIREELRFWSEELARPSSSPIVGPGAVISAHCDAGELAVGAVLSNGATFSEPLPVALIGASSTERELFGALRVLETQREVLSGRVVRLYMDSFAAIRNLIKGGGPVPRLVRMCKAIHAVARQSGITVQPTWIPREWNTEADALSKPWNTQPQFTRAAHERIAAAVSAARQHPRAKNAYLYAPAPNDLAFTIQRLRAERAVALVIAPEWPAQSWYQSMLSAVHTQWPLGSANEIWQRSERQQQYPQWQLAVFLVDFCGPSSRGPVPVTTDGDRGKCEGAADAAPRAGTTQPATAAASAGAVLAELQTGVPNTQPETATNRRERDSGGYAGVGRAGSAVGR